MSLKKTNGVGLKKEKKSDKAKYLYMYTSYTDDRKLKMVIVKDQWTAFLANFVIK